MQRDVFEVQQQLHKYEDAASITAATPDELASAHERIEALESDAVAAQELHEKTCQTLADTQAELKGVVESRAIHQLEAKRLREQRNEAKRQHDEFRAQQERERDLMEKMHQEQLAEKDRTIAELRQRLEAAEAMNKENKDKGRDVSHTPG